MSPRARVRSLQTKILGVVALGVSLPFLLGGFYLLRRHHELLTEKTRENLSNHLFRKASEVDDWVSERRREVQRWSGSFVVVEGVEALSRGRGDAAPALRDLNAYLDSVLGHYRGYESLFVVDPAGRVLASTREERLDAADVHLLGAGAADGIVGPIRRSAFLGRPSLVVAHPVERSGGGGRPIGFLVERPDLRELEGILATLPSEAPPSFWLLDAEGRVVVRQGRVEAEPGSAAFPGERPPADAEAGPMKESAFPGTGEVVYGVRRLKSGGFLAVTISASAAYRSLAESRGRLLAFGLAGLAAVMLVSLLVARGIVQPIRRLSEGAERMSAGDLDVNLPVQGQDELAELTRAFNQMAERVRQSRAALEALAITDGLTGLYNRRHFDDVLTREVQRARREKAPLSLAMIDLDRFKQYNDRWGHREGDVELVRVAVRVRQAVRATDLAFRYGGEELAVLLPACPRGEAVAVAEKIRLAINVDAPHLGGRGTSASLGVATAPDDAASPQELVEAADRALYAAKEGGRDRVAQAEGPGERPGGPSRPRP
ncbi:MAG TPA: diguanylate cyclase [Vicinamibacteria bacterium]